MEDDIDDFFMFKTKTTGPPKAVKTKAPKPKEGKQKKRHKSDDLSSDPGPSAPRRPKATSAVLNLSSDDDDDSPRASSSKMSAKKKARPKARPLTPPPETDFVAAAAARKIIEENLRSPTRREQYTTFEVEDEVDDFSVELDPTLARIRAEIAERGANIPLQQARASTSSTAVKLEIAMIANPSIVRNESNKRGLAFYEAPFGMTIGADDTFDNIYQRVAAQRGLGHDSLMLTYKDRRIYMSATPDSLGMFASAKISGYKMQDWEYIQTLRKKAEEEADQDSDIEIVDDGPSSSPVKAGKTLTLRGRGGRQYECDIQMGSTFRSLLKSYLTEFGEVDRLSKARLEFDGDAIDLSLTIADMPEIEDGDALDVIVH